MASLLYFLIYLGIVLLLTAQLFFPVYQVVDTYWDFRPDRVFYRLAMLIAILGFWPFLKLLGINNRYALGFTLPPSRFLLAMLKGLGIGVAIMVVQAAALVLLGARIHTPEAIAFDRIAYVLVSGLVSGVLVALIEETFFRGAMQYHLRYSNSLLKTAVITAVVYAAVHFVRPQPVSDVATTGWSIGPDMLLTMLHQYQDLAGIADSFVALFIAGLFLSLVRERSGSIALCMGIHAGWVMSIRLAREFTDVATDSPAAYLIGSYDGIIGWAAAALLALVTLGYWKFGAGK